MLSLQNFLILQQERKSPGQQITYSHQLRIAKQSSAFKLLATVSVKKMILINYMCQSIVKIRFEAKLLLIQNMLQDKSFILKATLHISTGSEFFG